jgi:exoribonuclease R
MENKKTQKEYYQRVVNLLTEIEVMREDLKELKLDFKLSEENPTGVDKELLDKADKVAAVYVKNQFSKKKSDWKELEESWKELVG